MLLKKQVKIFEVSAVANVSIKNEVGKWDVCLVGPQLFSGGFNSSTIKYSSASIEPRVYAMADGAAAIEMETIGVIWLTLNKYHKLLMQVITYVVWQSQSYLEAF